MGKTYALRILGFNLICLFIGFFLLIVLGTSELPVKEVLNVICGRPTEIPYARTIVLETRLPMAIGAACCGSLLSCAGIMMQTVFNNPLAGPSVLGISSGASFGVALMMLSAGGGLGALFSSIWQPVLSVVCALLGGLLIIFILYLFSSFLKSGVSLLIVGIMISYLCSSGIALLNYFSPADEIRNFLVWGLGSFTGLRLSTSVTLLILSLVVILPTFFFIKPLNALLLGERYLESVGFSARKIRGSILILTGLLVSVATAFCGPIGFIGLIVPHLCRLLFRTSNHIILLPACVLTGATVSIICAILTVLTAPYNGILPINVVTPIIGVPVILYLLVNRHRIPYFSR